MQLHKICSLPPSAAFISHPDSGPRGTTADATASSASDGPILSLTSTLSRQRTRNTFDGVAPAYTADDISLDPHPGDVPSPHRRARLADRPQQLHAYAYSDSGTDSDFSADSRASSPSHSRSSSPNTTSPVSSRTRSPKSKRDRTNLFADKWKNQNTLTKVGIQFPNLKDCDSEAFLSRIKNYTDNVHKFVAGVLKANLRSLQLADTGICIMTTGSDGRNEKGMAAKLILQIVYDSTKTSLNPEGFNLLKKIISELEETYSDIFEEHSEYIDIQGDIFFRQRQESEASANSVNDNCFPTRPMDAKFIYGSETMFQTFQTTLIDHIIGRGLTKNQVRDNQKGLKYFKKSRYKYSLQALKKGYSIYAGKRRRYFSQDEKNPNKVNLFYELGEDFHKCATKHSHLRTVQYAWSLFKLKALQAHKLYQQKQKLQGFKGGFRLSEAAFSAIHGESNSIANQLEAAALFTKNEFISSEEVVFPPDFDTTILERTAHAYKKALLWYLQAQQGYHEQRSLGGKGKETSHEFVLQVDKAEFDQVTSTILEFAKVLPK